MRKPVLTIFYQFDPWNSTIGGIQTLICSFLKYAPDDFQLRVVGITSDPNVTLGRWHELEFNHQPVLFMPLLYIENDDIRGLIPTTLKYTSALLGRRFASDFMHFYRLEPSLMTFNWEGDKTLFIQNDIRQQMTAKTNDKAILWRKFPAVYFALEQWLVGQFDHILSCNADSMRLYQQRYPDLADRISYFNNTVDSEVFYSVSRQERDQRRQRYAKDLGQPEETRFILFAGRLHPQKNPSLLVQSIAALDDPTVHLLIAGAGELEGEVRSLIQQLDLSSRITLLGPVNQTGLATLHQFCSLCILTSDYEGLPFVVLEALACGTPIVTTRCGDTPSLLTPESGVVCEDNTPIAVANAMQQVLDHPERYPAEACVRVAQPYSAKSVIGAVYDDMLQRWQRQLVAAA
jgi:glycosyltransferase involved in cell wall biosynthesis